MNSSSPQNYERDVHDRARMTANNRAYLARLSPEQRAERNARRRDQNAQERTAETPEQRRIRLQRDHQRRRDRETPEQRARREQRERSALERQRELERRRALVQARLQPKNEMQHGYHHAL